MSPEPIDDELDLREALARACAEASDDEEHQMLSAVADRLKLLGPTDTERPSKIGAVVAALHYHYLGRRPVEGVFGPMFAFDGHIYPIPLELVETSTCAVWAEAMDLAPLPCVRARLADLLWEVRFGDSYYKYGQRAVYEYIDAADSGFGHPVEITDGLLRALTVARLLRDEALIERASTAVHSYAAESLAAVDAGPGVTFPLLEAMADLPDGLRPADLAQILDCAFQRYGADPWHFESLQEIRSRLTPASDRRELWSEASNRFAMLARASSGILKVAHLQHAIELAETHDLGDLATDLRGELERISPDELDLKEVAVTLPIPNEHIERFIDQFVGDDSLVNAFQRFGSHDPTGDPDETKAQVDELMSTPQLRHLFTTSYIGPEGSLTRQVTGPDEHREHELILQSDFQLRLFETLAPEVLARIRARYGDLEDAAEWFDGGLIESSVARRIGSALRYYDDGDYDACASVLAPRIERVVRRMAAAIGLTITTGPSRSGAPGGVKGLGEILRMLTGRLHEPTRWYLSIMLTEQTSTNLRNRVGHALLDEASAGEAALLIHAACRLRIMAVVRREPE